MVQQLRRHLQCLTIIFFLAPAVRAQSLDLANLPGKLDSYLQPYVEVNDFSGVVLLAQKDATPVVRTYGLANRTDSLPNRRNTAFRVASVSKTFTAAAIVMLSEKGILSIQDHLSQFFPDFPNGDHITVEQLLTHESGVGELDSPELSRRCPDPEEMVKLIAKVPPFFPPGTDDRYSNEGYVLLAAIIQRVSRLSYSEYLRKNIFIPLGLNHTGTMCANWTVEDHADGYIAGLGTGVESLKFNEAGWDGPGSVYSTADDLLAWLKAVNTNRLFKFGQLEYPYGWGKRNYSGKNLVEQSGQLEGYTAHIAVYPDEGIYLVFLNNIESGLFSRVPKDLDSLISGGKTSSPPVIRQVPDSASILTEYEGRYTTSAYPVPMKFESRNGTLFMHWGDSPFLRPLVLIGKDRFYSRAEYCLFEFGRNKQGQIVSLSVKWESSNLEFHRASVQSPTFGLHGRA